MCPAAPVAHIELEARALLVRLNQIRPFALTLPMVMGAAPSQAAWSAIENYLATNRARLRRDCQRFIRWLRGPGRAAPPHDLQRRLAFLRLLVLSGINQFDIFADALAMRSQHGIGQWLGGLDIAAADALEFPPGVPVEAPPIVCYLDRGHGAAIRRARTRLPGGGDNPAAIIQVPWERMVGSAISGSLIHEVGHQAAALLELVPALRLRLDAVARRGGPDRVAWDCFRRWISEIVADLWAVAHLGIGATVSLIGVVSLPRPFVFRTSLEDPHPFPWIRVLISAAFGRRLFPHSQWDDLERLWERLYPLGGLDPVRMRLYLTIRRTIPAFVDLVCRHRPRLLSGRSLLEILPLADRQPQRLRALYSQWRRREDGMAAARPTLALAVIGQAKFDGRLSAEDESRLIGRLLRYWAYRGSVDTAAMCLEARRKQHAVARAV
jgi:hypothetical protein